MVKGWCVIVDEGMNKCIAHLVIKVIGSSEGPYERCALLQHTFSVLNYSIAKIVEDLISSTICSCTMCEANLLETSAYVIS